MSRKRQRAARRMDLATSFAVSSSSPAKCLLVDRLHCGLSDGQLLCFFFGAAGVPGGNP